MRATIIQEELTYGPARSLSRVLRVVCGTLALTGMSALAGCKDLAGNAPLPAGTPDPASLRTPEGALAMYQGAVTTFEYIDTEWGAFLNAVLESGLLSDELEVNTLGGSPAAYQGLLNTPLSAYYRSDARMLPEGTDNILSSSFSYTTLQTFRARANQAIGALGAYAPNAPGALRGELYALQGYAEILLADLYCSGIPLSTVDFEGDYTYREGSTTTQVYQHAVTLFDQALALASDSARIVSLAQVGKGRALLNMGQYAAAAAAVHDVPTGFQSGFLIDWSGGVPGTSLLTRDISPGTNIRPGFGATVADREGVAGLPYRSGGDPRTAADSVSANPFHRPRYWPRKYGAPTSVSQMTVASGIEARLIEAEAALQGVSVGRDWLTILNLLRADSGFTAIDPATVTTQRAREDTLFAERAAWLFLTGHRLGDLRRLVRQYPPRTSESVFPSGPYIGPIRQYGTSVNFPIPSDEKLINPLFHGCLSRGV